jgi:hypothetical protein
MEKARTVKEQVLELGAQLSEDVPMRRGSISERYVKCSKPGCGCATDPTLRHGPYYSLTRGVGGTTRSKFLTKEQAAKVREQIAAGQRFRKRVEAFWCAAEEWADIDLSMDSEDAGERAGKKNVFRKHSTKKSSGK